MKIQALDFIIYALGIYRLTHLIVFDKIFEPIRNLFIKRDYENGTFTLQGGSIRRYIGSLINCPWCTSIWVSALTVISYYYFECSTYWICLFLTFSAIASLIATLLMKHIGFPHLKDSETLEEEGEHVQSV